MTMARVLGLDGVLDAPPLISPPLSLLDLSLPLINVEDAIQAQEQRLEQLASAQAAVTDAQKRHADAPPEEVAAAAMAAEAAQDRLEQLRIWSSDEMHALARAQEWEKGFVYLPELSNTAGLEIVVPNAGTAATDGALKRVDSTQNPIAWCDPFDVIAHDDRSLFGWPHADFLERAQRAQRALIAHEPWQIEHEFWTGLKCPTNYHLTASPSTATSSPHRTIDAWPNPTAAPTTVLGTAVGLGQALAALDQAIANSDAGTGMIHATPYLVQRWMGVYPFIRDSSGRVYTVNMNLIVPGYGYPGTGPDAASRSVADAVTNATTTVTSATAAFTSADIGRTVTSPDLPTGTVVVAITNGTTIVVSAAATGSHSGQALTVSGAGGDRTGVLTQWAYATDRTYLLRGAIRTLPFDLRQGSPETTVQNGADVRAERADAVITNQLLRAAVLVDTTTA